MNLVSLEHIHTPILVQYIIIIIIRRCTLYCIIYCVQHCCTDPSDERYTVALYTPMVRRYAFLLLLLFFSFKNEFFPIVRHTNHCFCRKTSNGPSSKHVVRRTVVKDAAAWRKRFCPTSFRIYVSCNLCYIMGTVHAYTYTYIYCASVCACIYIVRITFGRVIKITT